MFSYSICEPLNPEILEKGQVTHQEFLEVLKKFPWQELQQQMDGVDDSRIFYSPSLELRDEKSNHGLAISIVGEEFYIFYKRPKIVTRRKWFKSEQILDPGYLSERHGQTEKDVNDAFNALLDHNFEELESRWG